MKLDAVGVSSSNFLKSIQFYKILGFEFPEVKESEQHVDSITKEGSIRLMIDKKSLIADIIGEEPRPGNHSCFAIQYDSPEEVNKIAEEIKKLGFKVEKEPWDAVWGQRYCVVEDPDGYKVDLYASL